MCNWRRLWSSETELYHPAPAICLHVAVNHHGCSKLPLREDLHLSGSADAVQQLLGAVSGVGVLQDAWRRASKEERERNSETFITFLVKRETYRSWMWWRWRVCVVLLLRSAVLSTESPDVVGSGYTVSLRHPQSLPAMGITEVQWGTQHGIIKKY